MGMNRLGKVRDGNRLVNEQSVCDRCIWYHSEKTNDEQLTWIVQRNKKGDRLKKITI